MKQAWDPWVKVQTGLAPAGPRMGALPPSGPVPLKVTVAPPDTKPYDARKGVRSLLIGVVFGLAAAYHGYRRTGSGVRAVPWAVAGFVCPVITLPFAISQGYAKKEG